MKNKTFNEFCEEYCDKMYDRRFSYEDQCTGYKLLREMVKENLKPFSEKEFKRWKNNPTFEEMLCEPDIRYMTFLHENLRPYIRKHWETIKKLPL